MSVLISHLQKPIPTGRASMADTQSIWRDGVSFSDLFESRLVGEQGARNQVFLFPDSVAHS